MADTGNIFDNSAAAPITGQGASPAGDGPQGTTIPAPADAGQAGTTPAPADGAGTQQTIPPDTNWDAEFKTPEEMYAAYKQLNQSYANIRPAFTKATTELSQLRRTATAPVVDNRTVPGPQTQVNPVEMLLNRVQEIVAPVREQNEELMMRTTLTQLASENPEVFPTVAPMMNEILQQNPKLWETATPIETAFELAQARYIKQNMSQMVATARQDAYADRDVRILNGGVRTQPNKPQQAPSEADTIKAGIMSVLGKNSHIF